MSYLVEIYVCDYFVFVIHSPDGARPLNIYLTA